jgi:hypothetical protein
MWVGGDGNGASGELFSATLVTAQREASVFVHQVRRWYGDAGGEV